MQYKNTSTHLPTSLVEGYVLNMWNNKLFGTNEGLHEHITQICPVPFNSQRVAGLTLDTDRHFNYGPTINVTMSLSKMPGTLNRFFLCCDQNEDLVCGDISDKNPNPETLLL